MVYLLVMSWRGAILEWQEQDNNESDGPQSPRWRGKEVNEGEEYRRK